MIDLECSCRFLQWDSDHFGVRIGLIDQRTMRAEHVVPIENWCHTNQVELIYFLANADDRLTNAVAAAAGYRFVDLRLTFVRSLTPPPCNIDEPLVRDWRPADLPELSAIARTSHRDTRFYFDGRLLEGRCDALYEAWLLRSCADASHRVLVAEQDGALAGYITCHLHSESTAQIGLIAVAGDYRGKGIGKSLLRAALSWAATAGASRMQVVTQGRNVVAQRLYQRSGFTTDRVGVWYHRWAYDLGPRK